MLSGLAVALQGAGRWRIGATSYPWGASGRVGTECPPKSIGATPQPWGAYGSALSAGLHVDGMQRQCVTFAVTIARVTVTQRMPLRQQQLKLRSWVGRLRYVLGIIQPRPLWPSPGSGGSRRCLAPAAGGVVILLNVGPPLLHPFNLLNIPAALCCRWFL